MADLAKATVMRREDLTEELFRLWLKPEISLTFKAGQYCTIGALDNGGNVVLDEAGRPLERPYSIVSAPHEKLIELFIELLPKDRGGNLTPLLWGLREGDEVSIRPRAKGVFTLEPKWRNHIMVATVTGIAPYVSMLRDAILRGDTEHQFFVLQGASYMDEFGYDDELMDMRLHKPGGICLAYAPTVSRPKEARNAEWGRKFGKFRVGRVNEILERHLGYWELSSGDTLIYVCGNPGMIEDVKDRFVLKGWRVKEERFFK